MDEGKHNGLYWKTDDQEAPRPIGPLLVAAASAGYKVQQGQAAPFHGYYSEFFPNREPRRKGVRAIT